MIDQHDLVWTLGRVLLGGFYAVAGIEHLFAVPALTQALASRGVPAPRFVLLVGTFLQTVAGGALSCSASRRLGRRSR
jgi:putative oxidoreductase